MTTRFLAGNHGVATPGSRVLPIVDRTLILYMRTHLEGRGPSVAGRGRPWQAMAGHGRPWPRSASVGWPFVAVGGCRSWTSSPMSCCPFWRPVSGCRPVLASYDSRDYVFQHVIFNDNAVFG